MTDATLVMTCGSVVAIAFAVVEVLARLRTSDSEVTSDFQRHFESLNDQLFLKIDFRDKLNETKRN